MTRREQWPQVGESAWIADSKLSNTYRVPAMIISKHLSYSFPHISHFAIARSSSLACAGPTGSKVLVPEMELFFPPPNQDPVYCSPPQSLRSDRFRMDGLS